MVTQLTSPQVADTSVASPAAPVAPTSPAVDTAALGVLKSAAPWEPVSDIQFRIMAQQAYIELQNAAVADQKKTGERDFTPVELHRKMEERLLAAIKAQEASGNMSQDMIRMANTVRLAIDKSDSSAGFVQILEQERLKYQQSGPQAHPDLGNGKKTTNDMLAMFKELFEMLFAGFLGGKKLNLAGNFNTSASGGENKPAAPAPAATTPDPDKEVLARREALGLGKMELSEFKKLEATQAQWQKDKDAGNVVQSTPPMVVAQIANGINPATGKPLEAPAVAAFTLPSNVPQDQQAAPAVPVAAPESPGGPVVSTPLAGAAPIDITAANDIDFATVTDGSRSPSTFQASVAPSPIAQLLASPQSPTGPFTTILNVPQAPPLAVKLEESNTLAGLFKTPSDPPPQSVVRVDAKQPEFQSVGVIAQISDPRIEAANRASALGFGT